jgi:hypothetical protein
MKTQSNSLGSKSAIQIWITVGVTLFSISLTGCGGSKNDQIDVCRPVLKAIGKFADLQLKKIQTDPASLGNISIEEKALADELNKISETLPDGKKKEYLKMLAEDYNLVSQPDASFEASMTLAADSQVDKLRIVCPQY